MEKFIDQLKNYKEQPRPSAWNEVSNRLEHRKHRKTIASYRKISVAAMLVAVMACLGVMSLFVKNYNPSKFATSDQFKPIVMERLVSASDDFYAVDHVRTLYADYRKAGIME